MQRGWDATGLLQPLWKKVGGRDKLAALTGIQPGLLSGYNTGRLRLGPRNAKRIAAALGVSVLDLGAPDEQADEQGEVLIQRVALLEDQLRRLVADVQGLRRRPDGDPSGER